MQENVREPRIFGLKIFQPSPGCYSISVKHTGEFRLDDYEELDLDVCCSRLQKRIF